MQQVASDGRLRSSAQTRRSMLPAERHIDVAESAAGGTKPHGQRPSADGFRPLACGQKQVCGRIRKKLNRSPIAGLMHPRVRRLPTQEIAAPAGWDMLPAFAGTSFEEPTHEANGIGQRDRPPHRCVGRSPLKKCLTKGRPQAPRRSRQGLGHLPESFCNQRAGKLSQRAPREFLERRHLRSIELFTVRKAVGIVPELLPQCRIGKESGIDRLQMGETRIYVHRPCFRPSSRTTCNS